MKEGKGKPFSFSFPHPDGGELSLNDKKFEGKAKIIQILGTWCPNCADETEFLANYFQRNPHNDIAIIGLAFEKHELEGKAFSAINTFKKRFGIDYDVLWAGSYKKKEAAKSLPMLNAVISYPTMIFLNKKNEVVKIHTGFNGPATSEFNEFVEEFSENLELITKED